MHTYPMHMSDFYQCLDKHVISIFSDEKYINFQSVSDTKSDYVYV